MKTTPFLSKGLACLLLAGRMFAATDVVAGWNDELDNLQQTSHQSPAGRTRTDAIVRAVLVGATTGLEADKQSGRPAEPAPDGANLEAAAAQAAYSVMAVLYPQNLPALDARLAQSLAEIDDSASAIAAGKKWGEHVAQGVLAKERDAISLNAYTFAKEVQALSALSSFPEVQAAQAAIGPGRYRFSVLAGVSGARGYVDGIGTAARFDNPVGIAVDAAGNTYVCEENMCTIRKITPDGVVSTLAGMAGQKGSLDGVGANARFNRPFGAAVDSAGNIYVADSENHTIRKIDPAGLVTTIAGVAGQAGEIDGPKEAARLKSPQYVAVDGGGTVFVSEEDRIRKIAPDGTVSTPTLKIPPHVYGYIIEFSGLGNSRPLPWPLQLCVDREGILYAIYTDYWDYADVVKLVPRADGTYAGTILVPPILGRYAIGIGLDGAGNLYAKYELDPIVIFAPGGEVERRYISDYASGYLLRDMTVDGAGKIFTLPANPLLGSIEIGTLDPTAIGPMITKQPEDKTLGRGQNAWFTVSAIGSTTLNYQWYFNSGTINGATTSYLDLRDVGAKDEGYYSVLVTDGTNNVTSRSAKLALNSSSPGDGGAAVVNLPPAGATGGGGSFDATVSLAVLGLLAMAARRGARTFTIAAVGTGGMKERA